MIFHRLARLLRDREVVIFLLAEVLASIVILILSWKVLEDEKEALLWAFAGIGLLWILTGRLQLAFLKGEIEHRFKENDRTLESVAGLRATVFKDPALSTQLKTIIAGAGKALEFEAPEFCDYIRNRVNTCALEMAGFLDGVVQAPTAISSKWAMDRMLSSKEIFATTFSKGNSLFWSSPGGREYLKANITAHRDHKVTITRAFILQDDVLSPNLLQVIKEHVANGLEAWIVRHSDLDPGLIEDFITFDFKIVSFWELAHSTDQLKYASWSSNDAYIAKAKDIREYLYFRSEKIKTLAEFDSWLKTETASSQRQVVHTV